MTATATLDGDGDEARSNEPAPVREAELDLGYQVQLDSFSGPLDLLLYLVRRAEVDITEIPLVTIADQFVATVVNWEEMDLDVAGDFILMAATLLEIKARLIMPPELLEEAGEQDDEEEDLVDPRADLIRQLLAYRRVKEAVQHLENLERERLHLHHRRFQETIPEDPEEGDFSLENADPYQLFAVWEHTLKQIAAHRPRTVLYDDIPIEERIKVIERTMREAREGQLSWLMEQATSQVQRCGVVVAVLESVRQKVVEANQHEQYGPVYLRYRDEEERALQPSAPPPEADEGEGKRKRRKRPPLFTYVPPSGQDLAGEDGHQEELEELEELLAVETDEQRFVRELNEQIGIDGLLDRAKELDRHLTAHLVIQGVITAPADFVMPEGMELPVAEAAAAAVEAGSADDEDDEDDFDDEDDEDDFDDEDDEEDADEEDADEEDADNEDDEDESDDDDADNEDDEDESDDDEDEPDEEEAESDEEDDDSDEESGGEEE